MVVNESSRRAEGAQQVNFTLDPHWRLVLRVVAEADGVTAPELIRPVVLRYLRNRMRNEDLKEAVARIERVRRSRQGVPDNVTPIPRAVPRQGRQRKPSGSRSSSTAEKGRIT